MYPFLAPARDASSAASTGEYAEKLIVAVAEVMRAETRGKRAKEVSPLALIGLPVLTAIWIERGRGEWQAGLSMPPHNRSSEAARHALLLWRAYYVRAMDQHCKKTCSGCYPGRRNSLCAPFGKMDHLSPPGTGLHSCSPREPLPDPVSLGRDPYRSANTRFSRVGGR